jgi:hypothetical protein
MVAVAESQMALLILMVSFAALALLVSGIRSGMDKRANMLWRIEAKVDLLLKHSNIEFDPYGNLPREVTDAVGRGEKIRAIKSWREVTGAGLKEAKDFIEEVQRRSNSN